MVKPSKIKGKKASLAKSNSTNLTTIKSTKSLASLTKDQRKQISDLESNYSRLDEKRAKLADSEQTQEMLSQQLKKYKSLVAIKTQKMAVIEQNLVERKREISLKQQVFDDQTVSKCHSDKEMLVRLKTQAKNLKTQHGNLKKQVLVEA